MIAEETLKVELLFRQKSKHMIKNLNKGKGGDNANTKFNIR